MTETPFLILITYIAFATVIFFVGLIMGLRKISGSPFMCIFAGVLIFGMLAITDDIGGEGLTGNSTQSVNAVINDHMNQQTSSGSIILRSGSNIFAGEDVVNFDSELYGKEVNHIQLRLSKTGSPTGFMYVGVWDALATPTSTNYKFIIGQRDVSTLLTGVNDISWTRNDTKTWFLDVNEAIGVFYDGGSAGNEVNIFTNTTSSSFDASNSAQTRYTTFWTDLSTADLRGKISFITHEANIKHQPYDFNQWDMYVYLSFMAIFYMLTGIAFQWQDWKK